METSKKIETKNCHIHGDFQYEAKTTLGVTLFPRCPKCTEAEDDKKRDEAIRKSRQKEQEELSELYEGSGIPQRYDRSGLGNFKALNVESKKAITLCTEYADKFIDNALEDGQNLLFVGPPGTGKTHLGIGIMHRIMRNDLCSALYTTVSGFTRGLRSTFKGDAFYTEEEYFARYSDCDLLVFDEIGLSLGSDFDQRIIFELIDKRYSAMLPTIFISNLSVDGVSEVFGERAMDRIAENAKLLAFEWDSYRNSGKAKK